MPFGLKNAGSTYQRLVNKMFKEKLGDIMEVNNDDMVVKSKKDEDHLKDLEEAFDILDQYNMKLDPSKCHFGMRSRKFLGCMVTKRGIEARQKQMKAILDLKSPPSIKDIQRLTGRVAALNRFISRSPERCKPFYDIFKKNKIFKWTQEHEDAYQELKKHLSSPPLSVKLLDGEPILLYLSVSLSAVSVVQAKDLDGNEHPIYYVSKNILDLETRFVAKFSDDLRAKVKIEAKQLVEEENMGRWILFTDGISNQRGTGLGIILKSLHGDILPYVLRCEFNATNNEVEYEALIMGIQLVKDLQIKDPHVFIESLLLTNHFNGSYVVKGEKLVLYLQILKNLASKFKTFTLNQVPREDNAEADALANLGSSLRIPLENKILIAYVLTPKIEDPIEGLRNPNDHEETVDVAAIEDPDSTTQHQDPNIQDPSPTLGS
ncbi:uncharacterized protein LOC111901196 [Lactuca sativa]|uniref:uncharacterized protein LOC111901196 n=1 Tax=Lactuca sativa TaxID=4236 RepID=UPI000CD80BE3|nr:uncharacterized protein LOC111901196 [Lactuca sativa]